MSAIKRAMLRLGLRTCENHRDCVLLGDTADYYVNRNTDLLNLVRREMACLASRDGPINYSSG